jgi:thiol-disulfide isomerase/thioredoxin
MVMTLLLMKDRWTIACLVGLFVAVVTTSPGYRSLVAQEPAAKQSAAPATPTDERNIRGSGKVITRELSITDFTMVEVARSFRVEITRADAFRVAITADDNLFPAIKAVNEGSTLRLALDVNSFWASALKVTIAMPALEGVRLAHGGRVTLQGFKPIKAFQARLTNSSTLEGTIEADKLDLEAAGNSQMTLKGSAKEARISASDGCLLFLTDLVLGQADVTLMNGAKAAINVKERLDYDLSSACRLEFPALPARAQGRTSGDSSALTSATPGEGWAKAKQGSSHHQHGGAPAQGPQAKDAARPAPVAVGRAVPDFSLQDLDGKALKFGDLQKDAQRTGKGALVLTIWCSTCASCRRIEHALDKLARDYHDKALVVALDVNAGETPGHVKAFAKDMGLTLPILLNPDGRAADIFGTEVTTTTVVIDRDGVLRYCGRFSAGDQRVFAEDALKAVLAGKEVAIKETPHDG